MHTDCPVIDAKHEGLFLSTASTSSAQHSNTPRNQPTMQPLQQGLVPTWTQVNNGQFGSCAHVILKINIWIDILAKKHDLRHAHSLYMPNGQYGQYKSVAQPGLAILRDRAL